MKLRRSQGYKPGIYGLCLFSLIWVTFLLFAGGFTTSIDAGMAFLDWPLSNGSINPEGWTVQADMMAEHSHRLLGMKIGFLSIILVAVMWYWEDRPWVRRLAWMVLFVVILQGVLGGARVLLDRLNTGADDNSMARTFAVLHACGAQVTLCLFVTLAAASSRFWHQVDDTREEPNNQKGFFGKVRTLSQAASIVLFLTLIIGAIMRHANAGLAIPSFPLSSMDGHIFPPHWNWAVTINFSHRTGALISSLIILYMARYVWKSDLITGKVKLTCFLPCVILLLQVLLGAIVIWSGINKHAATLHMLMGAFLLASVWLVVIITYRLNPK